MIAVHRTRSLLVELNPICFYTFQVESLNNSATGVTSALTRIQTISAYPEHKALVVYLIVHVVVLIVGFIKQSLGQKKSDYEISGIPLPYRILRQWLYAPGTIDGYTFFRSKGQDTTIQEEHTMEGNFAENGAVGASFLLALVFPWEVS